MARRRRKRGVLTSLALAGVLLIAVVVLCYAAFVRVWSGAHPVRSAAPWATTPTAEAPRGEDLTDSERRGLESILQRKAAKEHP